MWLESTSGYAKYSDLVSCMATCNSAERALHFPTSTSIKPSHAPSSRFELFARKVALFSLLCRPFANFRRSYSLPQFPAGALLLYAPALVFSHGSKLDES